MPQEPDKTKDPLAALNRLPAVLRLFLFSDDTQNKFLEILKNNRLENSPELPKISFIIGDIDLGFRPLSNLVASLVREIGWKEEQAKKFAVEIAGYRYLPISDFLNINIWKTIEDWGGDPSKFPIQKIEARTVTADALSDEILKEAQITLSPRLAERFQFLLNSRFKGVRDDAELIEMLMRVEKIGGAGMSEKDAERVIGIIHIKLANANIVDKLPEITAAQKQPVPTVKSLNDLKPISIKDRPTLDESLPAAKKFASPASAVEITETPPELPAKRPASALTVLPEDEEEIRGIKNELKGKFSGNDGKIRESVASIVNSSKIKLADSELETRFRGIIEARLKDLRDAVETRILLTRPASQNGLGLNSEQADKLINLIEADFIALQKQLEAAQTKEKTAFLAAKTSNEELEIQAAQKQEADALDKRYLETLKKSKILKEKDILLPRPKTSSPLPSTIKAAPPKTKPVLSPSSIPPPSIHESKPIVSDIVFSQKIKSPTEELRDMSIVEFRRLSKNPKEGTQKIKDKIELLKEESYERYGSAVGAWQQSEPSRLYLEISRNALQTGKPVPEIIKEKTAAAEPTLSLEEFQAILALNTNLMF